MRVPSEGGGAYIGMTSLAISGARYRVPGGSTWIRTRDLPVMSRSLSPLSYGP